MIIHIQKIKQPFDFDFLLFLFLICVFADRKLTDCTSGSSPVKFYLAYSIRYIFNITKNKHLILPEQNHHL